MSDRKNRYLNLLKSKNNFYVRFVLKVIDNQLFLNVDMLLVIFVLRLKLKIINDVFIVRDELRLIS